MSNLDTATHPLPGLTYLLEPISPQTAPHNAARRICSARKYATEFLSARLRHRQLHVYRAPYVSRQYRADIRSPRHYIEKSIWDNQSRNML